MNKSTRWPMTMAVIALVGCASSDKVISAFDGPDRSDRDVAILFTPAIDAPSRERSGGLLSAVDGKAVGSYMDGYPRATKVLPGSRLIKVGCLDAIFNKNMDFRLLRATFEAGHYYELICSPFSVAAVDRGTDYASVEPLLSDSLKKQLRR